jgi:hypothetical protein
MIVVTGSLELFCSHTAHIFIRQSLVFVLFVGYCLGEIMCIRDSYVYQKGVLCFLIKKVTSGRLKRYRFVRQYVTVPV